MDTNYLKVALSHHSKGNWNKAREIYEHILKSNPNNFLVLQNYGALLSQLREYKLAKNIFEKCLKIKPKDFLLLYNYAKFYHDQKIFDKAIKFYEASYKIEPKNNLSLYNVGNIYSFQNKFELAISAFQKSTKENPKNFLAYNNIAIAYKNLGDFDKALMFYKEAINVNNDYVDGHVNYSTMLMTLGKLEEGLEEYEWRKKSKSFSDYIDYRSLNLKSKVWNGEDIFNKKLFVIAEQGIGDLIQFTRYLYLIKNEYKVQITLKIKSNKFSHFFDKNDFKVISEKKFIPKHDYHVHMMSLLRIFFKKNKFYYKTINFLKTKKETHKKWKEKLNKVKGVKIGINCSTSSIHKNIPLNYFCDLADKHNYNFFILQKDLNSDQYKKISNNQNIFYFKDLDSNEKAFIDTIELTNNLDLVITADTALAHISATQGKETWIALPYVADWRWFLNENRTQWYSDVKLFRQKKIGDWKSVFNLIDKKLKIKF